MKCSKDLLEEIVSYTHCDYLSDLHLSSYFSEIIEAIKKISLEDYSLDEWCNAIQYITQQKVNVKNKEGAVEFLNEYLNQNHD